MQVEQQRLMDINASAQELPAAMQEVLLHVTCKADSAASIPMQTWPETSRKQKWIVAEKANEISATILSQMSLSQGSSDDEEEDDEEEDDDEDGSDGGDDDDEEEEGGEAPSPKENPAGGPGPSGSRSGFRWPILPGASAAACWSSIFLECCQSHVSKPGLVHVKNRHVSHGLFNCMLALQKPEETALPTAASPK